MLSGGFYRIRRGEEQASYHETVKEETFSITECLDEQCAYALSWGMPYSLFWNGPIEAFEIYREKAKIESFRKDEEAWANGHYMIRAIVEALNPKSKAYPQKPLLVLHEERERQNQEGKQIAIYNRLKSWTKKAKKYVQQKEAQC